MRPRILTVGLTLWMTGACGVDKSEKDSNGHVLDSGGFGDRGDITGDTGDDPSEDEPAPSPVSSVEAGPFDSDGDCIPDVIELGPWGPQDTDGDGLPNHLDPDSDGNGLEDGEEAGCSGGLDSDRDGTPDHLDLDDDNDSIFDVEDGMDDFDGDGEVDRLDRDADEDCIPDRYEAGDSDLDTPPLDTDGDGAFDHVDIDADGDGLRDTVEVEGECDPPRDLDGDRNADHIDTDTDGDGLDDRLESTLGTDFRDRDSDDDGFTDGLENFANTDPLSADDFPLGTIIEVEARDRTEGTAEYEFETDKVDIFLLVDTAYSYSCWHPDIPTFVDQLVTELFARYENMALGFGTYDDYAMSGWNASGGVPVRIAHQISTDAASIRSAATGMSMIYGGDDAGSTYEALYQAATGDGYDQTCDGALDASVDVQPFHASSTDAFSGATAGSYNPDVEGTGALPGVGFRDGALPVFFIAADNRIRDPAYGDSMPSGACFGGASLDDAVDAVNDMGAKVLGINVYEYWSSDSTLQGQLDVLAERTDSFIDKDGDGIKTDPAALYGSWDWPEISTIVDALWDLAEERLLNGTFQIGDDPRGWVEIVSPLAPITEVSHGETVSVVFAVTISAEPSDEDAFYSASIQLKNTDDEVLFTHPIWVVIVPEHRSD
jgi:hypothetical protein